MPGIFHLKVPESSPIGSAIGRIRAVDPDFGQNAEIEYNIVPGDGGNLFDIVTDEDTQEGVIKLKKVIDKFLDSWVPTVNERTKWLKVVNDRNFFSS